MQLDWVLLSSAASHAQCSLAGISAESLCCRTRCRTGAGNFVCHGLWPVHLLRVARRRAVRERHRHHRQVLHLCSLTQLSPQLLLGFKVNSKDVRHICIMRTLVSPGSWLQRVLPALQVGIPAGCGGLPDCLSGDAGAAVGWRFCALRGHRADPAVCAVSRHLRLHQQVHL